MMGAIKLFFDLAATLYPQGDKPYTAVRGNLFYGGTWTVLPSAAYRQLYIVIACLDRIGDDDDWAISEPAARAVAIQMKLLAEQRERHSLSMRDLVEYARLRGVP